MKKNKQLKAAANELKPVVIVGTQGLSESVHKKIESCLDSHELIKIRINSKERETRLDIIGRIIKQHDATLIKSIGHVTVIYRKNEED
jgi:RNA-binding protein